MDSRNLRNSLAVLASNLPIYSEKIREAGFTCSHNAEDWIRITCSNEELAFHQRYLVEYAREALLSDSVSGILMNDELNCHSSWLNELKAKRYSDFGAIDNLLNSDEMRYKIELSPGLRKLSWVMGLSDRTERNGLLDSFMQRREAELRLHREQIGFFVENIDQVQDESFLQDLYARRVAEDLEYLGAQIVHSVQMYGSEAVVEFAVGSGMVFALIPIVSSRHGSFCGSVGMGFRVTDAQTLRAPQFDKSKYAVAHLHSLLPKEFSEYGRFSSAEEFALNVLSWLAALKVLLPDVLRVLREQVADQQTLRK